MPVDMQAVPAGSQVTVRVTLEADTRAKPVCVADFVVRYLATAEKS
jgi:hypothetical protein